jgi:hypothetical protein
MSNLSPRLSSLTLAAYGWSPADWAQHFYPDDLPQDWWVSYYANEFKSVLLPANRWEVPLAEAAFWHAEAGADFSFYLEVTADLLQAGYWPQVQAAVEQHLAGQVAGLLVEVAALPQLPASWQERFPVHRLQPANWLAAMPAGADAQLGLLRSTHTLPPLALREVFETMQQHTAHRDVVLFLDAPLAVLDQIRLMQQLYGV